MTKGDEYRHPGMSRPIARRDFLNGIAVGITGAYAASRTHALSAASGALESVDSADGAALDGQQASGSSGDYPPARSGLRGNYPSAVEAFPHMQQGEYRQFPALDVDTHEEYDLVV